MKVVASVCKFFTNIALTFGIVLLTCLGQQAQAAPDRLRVQFGWLLDVHHAGFLLAKDLGYYADTNTEVFFLPGGLDSNPVKAVATGAAEIGQAGGLEQLVSAWAEGIPITAFASFHRSTPHALVSLDRQPIRVPADLRGRTVAVAFGDAAEVLFNALLQRNGLSRADVKVVPFRFDLNPLINGSVDAVTGFSTDQPATLERKNFAPTVLTYASQGIRSYGYTFFTSTPFAEKNGTLLKRFSEASRKGWDYVFANPDEAIARLNKILNNSLDLPAERLKLERLRPLMLSPDGRLPAWELEQDVVAEVAGRMLEQKQIKAIPQFRLTTPTK